MGTLAVFELKEGGISRSKLKRNWIKIYNFPSCSLIMTKMSRLFMQEIGPHLAVNNTDAPSVSQDVDHDRTEKFCGSVF